MSKIIYLFFFITNIAFMGAFRVRLRMKRIDCIENRSDLTNARIGRIQQTQQLGNITIVFSTCWVQSLRDSLLDVIDQSQSFF